MKVIGAGIGRTGTLSLKKALEEIGYGPCYHMVEVFKTPKHVKYWLAAAEGEAVDWLALFEKYQSCVDYPASIFYQDIFKAFPDTKILLTVRDPDRWYDSTLKTIYQASTFPQWLKRALPFFGNAELTADAAVWDGLFEGRFEDRAFAIEVFNQWVETVKQQIPAERLLVFEVRQGWEPLCKFLGVPVPDRPFPHLNERKQMQLVFGVGKFLSLAVPALLISGIIWLLLI